jgi:hypothetical protein
MQQERERSNPSNPPNRYAGSQFNNNMPNQNFPQNMAM